MRHPYLKHLSKMRFSALEILFALQLLSLKRLHLSLNITLKCTEELILLRMSSPWIILKRQYSNIFPYELFFLDVRMIIHLK